MGKSKFTPEKEIWLKANYNKTYSEMSEHLGICEETIRTKINDLGLIRTSRYRPYKLNMSDEEFLADLDNPRLTAPDIVDKYKDKYGIGESRIHQLRKEKGIKLQINTLAREGSGERAIREILDKLDVAYIKEKSIGKYHIDFYLGHKACIEVQGSYWHTRKERKLRDIKKRKYLRELGYKVLVIWDTKLDTAEDYILEFAKELGLPV